MRKKELRTYTADSGLEKGNIKQTAGTTEHYSTRTGANRKNDSPPSVDFQKKDRQR